MDNPKCQLRKRVIYDLMVEDRCFGTYSVKEAWEGMVKFLGPDPHHNLIVEPYPTPASDLVLNSAPQLFSVTIVKGNVELLHAIAEHVKRGVA